MPPLQLRVDDVETTLHETAHVRNFGLERLAFGSHRPHIVGAALF